MEKNKTEIPKIYDQNGNELGINDEVWTAFQCYVRDIGHTKDGEVVVLLEAKYNWFDRTPNMTIMSKKFDPNEQTWLPPLSTITETQNLSCS